MTVSSRSDLAGMQRVGSLVADTLGDTVKLDVSLELDGSMADSACTVIVPPASPEALLLWPDPSARTVLVEGMVMALEPMLTRVPTRIVEEREGWTIRTANRAIAVHHEQTIMIRDRAPLVLTTTRATAW